MSWPLMLSNKSWALDLWSLNIMPNEMLLDFSSFSCSLHHKISKRLCNYCNYWQWNCDKENFWIWYPSIWITEGVCSIMWPLSSMDTQEHIHWKFVDNQLLLIRHLFEFEYRHHHWWWAIVFDILCRHFNLDRLAFIPLSSNHFNEIRQSFERLWWNNSYIWRWAWHKIIISITVKVETFHE